MTTTPQIAVVGGGPAGLAAASEAARVGLTVHLYDERPALGGPVYGGAAESGLLAELHGAGSRIVLHQRTTVWGIFEQRTLAVWEQDRAESVRAEVIVLAPGAHTRCVPIPGWTLPGVTSAETIWALVETRTLPPGQRVLVAGTGPLLPVVASRLVRAGAEVVAVLDAVSSPRARRALPPPWGQWALAGDATVDWRTLRAAHVALVGSRTVARVVGDEAVREAVTVALDDAWRPLRGSEKRIEVGAVCLVWGSVPSTHLAQLCGAEHRYAAERGGWVPAVSAEMETTVPGVFSVGDGAGIGGAAVAVLEGRVAGLAAAARLGVLSPSAARSQLRPHQAVLTRLRKSQEMLGRLTAARVGLAELITPDTVICPCERITGARIDQAVDEGAGDFGQLKRMTRAGMGQCQGRMCSPGLAMMLAQRRGIPLEAIAPPSIRPPVTPIPVHVLATLPDE